MKKTFQLAAGLLLSTTLALTQIPALPVLAVENQPADKDEKKDKESESKNEASEEKEGYTVSLQFTSNEENTPEIKAEDIVPTGEQTQDSFELTLPETPEDIPEGLTFIGFRADFGNVNVEGNGKIYASEDKVAIPAEKILAEQEDKTKLNLVFEALYKKKVEGYDLKISFAVPEEISDRTENCPLNQGFYGLTSSVFEFTLPDNLPFVNAGEQDEPLEFIGWQGLDGRLYQPGDTVTLTAEEMEQADEEKTFSTTFMAQFEEVPQTKTLTLTYLNAEGKTFETQKIEAEAAAGFIGKTEIIDKEPEKDGWTFSHWEHGGRDDDAPDTDTDQISWYSRKVENVEGIKEAYPNCYGELCTSKDLTLYPVFEKDIQYISYDDSKLDTQKLYWHPGENEEGVFSDFKIEVENPEVEGYTFEGWRFGKKNYQKGQTVPDLKEDSTLKAVFSYEVNVTYLDGSTDLKLGKPQEGSTAGYTLKLTNDEPPAKSGKTFQGWSFKGKTYKPGASIPISDLAKEFEVKAVFTSGKTPVPSNPKNPTPTGNYSYYYNPDGSYIKRRKLTLADNSDNQFKSFYMRLTMDEDSPYSEDKGYKLIGWKSGDTLYRLGAVVRKADIEAPMQFTAVVSYDADIEYKVDGVTVLNHEQSITTDGKQKDPGGSFKATDFIPVKEGYVFKGWSLSGNGSLIEPNDDVTTTDLSRTLSMEAEFEPDTGSKGYSYQFRYLDQDGNVYDYGTISGTRANSSETFSGSVSQSFKTLGEGPSKSGDKFVGWAIGTNPPVFVRAGEPIGAYSGGTVSLTAVYESDLNADGTFKNPEKFGQVAKDPAGPDNQNSKTGSDPETKKFTISFIANGKTTTREVTADADGKATFTLDSAPTREGYTFKGWKNATDKETYNAGATVTVTADTKYSAVWTKNGSTSTDSTSRSSDNKTTSSPRTGQATHLTGWLTSASLSALAAFALIRKQRRKDK